MAPWTFCSTHKRVLPPLGYTDGAGRGVNLSVDVVLGEVGAAEDEVFQRRKGADDWRSARPPRSRSPWA